MLSRPNFSGTMSELNFQYCVHREYKYSTLYIKISLHLVTTIAGIGIFESQRIAFLYAMVQPYSWLFSALIFLKIALYVKIKKIV